MCFQLGLGTAILTPTAVQDRKDHVLRRIKPVRQALRRELDEPGAREHRGHGAAGPQRDLAFGGKPAA